MARLIQPSTFSQQENLSVSINKKHTDDGAKSVLTPYFTENNIDPAKFAAMATEAQSHETARALLFGQSKQSTELRDVKFKQPLANMKEGVQSLKRLYSKTPQKLVEWGIVVTGDNKISYPTSFDELSPMVLNFGAKHLSFPAGKSPLDAFVIENGIDFAKDTVAVEAAQAANNDAKSKAEQSAKETELRNAVWQPVVKQLNDIGQFLLGIFPKTPRKIISWGFAVDTNPTKAKEVKTTIKLGDQITLKGVIIGSTLKNTGDTDLHIYKGKSTKGDPIIVKPGESWGVLMKYSTITVSNPDALKASSFTTFRSA
jgi:hypothetical protein